MTGRYPRLRSQQRKRKSGRVIVYYFYDRRPEGLPSIPLGTDYDEALKRWDEIHNVKPRIAGTLEEAFQAWEQDQDDGLLSYDNAETRRGYAKNLRMLRPSFQAATWDSIDLSTLKRYLKLRTAKTQANREMSLLQVVWNYARGEGLTPLPWPAAGMEKSKWKNKEQPRRIKVLDVLWDAIHDEGDQVLRDCMDLASVTGMRLTDCITILLPRGDAMHLEARKTGKEAEWDLSDTEVVPGLIRRRRALDANHLMLLSTPDGRPVTKTMLRYRWDLARERAAVKASIANDEAAVAGIRKLILRDARKRAAQNSASLEDAQKLLQHGDSRTTERHYGAVRKLRPLA